MKCYIPLNVEIEIQNSNFKNKDKLRVICDLILKKSLMFKEKKSDCYVQIPYKNFRKLLPKSSSCSETLNFLIDSKIIISNNKYSVKYNRAKGYRFSGNVLGEIIEIELKNNCILKRLNHLKCNEVSFEKDWLKSYKEYFLKNFKIDYEASIIYIKEWYEKELKNNTQPLIQLSNKYSASLLAINLINNKELYFDICSTNGRIDTNLTSLRKDLKKFIFSENYVQIDIVNSQPFFMALLMNQEKNKYKIDELELYQFTNLTENGKFYEIFSNKLANKRISRDEVKKIMFSVLYSKNGSFRAKKEIFKSLFSSIFDYTISKKTDKHNEFAIQLQKMESEICLNTICPIFYKRGIKYFTIHDAWIVDKNDADEALIIIQNVFRNKFKTCPTFTVEEIH